MEKRRQQQGDSIEGSSEPGKRGGKLRRAIMEAKSNSDSAGGFDIEKYPRLMMAQRKKLKNKEITVNESTTKEELVEHCENLEDRVKQLESSLKIVMAELDTFRKHEGTESPGSGRDEVE
jgi:hypothetical protein